MANKNSPSGAQPTSTLASANYNEKLRKFVIPSTDTNNYFIGDFVKTNNTSINGIPIVVKAAAGEVIRGTIVSFEQDLVRTQVPYRKSGVEQVVYVCEDPLLEFEIQFSGTLTDSDIGKFANILVGTGDTNSGFSTTQLDGTTLSTTNAQIKILSIVERVENEVGQYAKVIGTMHQHELNGVGSGGSMDHAVLSNLSYDNSNHGSGFNGFQRGTTNSAIDPTINDDDTSGYVKGDLWLNTTSSEAFICVDNATGAAVWHEIEHSISDIWNRNPSTTTVSLANAGDTTQLDSSGGLQFGAGQNVTSIVTTVSSSSTNTGLPTALAVYNAILASDQVPPPSGPTDTGTAGEWAYGSGYMYRCVATNTWVRWAVVTSW